MESRTLSAKAVFAVLCRRAMKRRAFLRGLGAAGGLAFAPALAPRARRAAASRVLDRLRDAQIKVVSRAS